MAKHAFMDTMSFFCWPHYTQGEREVRKDKHLWSHLCSRTGAGAPTTQARAFYSMRYTSFIRKKNNDPRGTKYLSCCTDQIGPSGQPDSMADAHTASSNVMNGDAGLHVTDLIPATLG